MQYKKQDILRKWHSRPYLNFGDHKKLLALCVTVDNYNEMPGYDYDEIIFTVPCEWLLNWLWENDNANWTEEKMIEWLQSEYTSEDSEEIFNDAMIAQQIVTLNFN